MNIKTSAHYQREYRRRLREQGLVKKEIWIRPEQADRARAFEKALRENPDAADPTLAAERAPWSTNALYGDLLGTALVKDGRASCELIDGADAALVVVMHEYGDLPLFVTVAGDQLVVEAVLWRRADVVDPVAFDETVLRTHKYFPLSTLCLEPRADEDYYLMFGALGAAAGLPDIVRLVGLLASNVIHATEAYADFLVAHEADTGESE